MSCETASAIVIRTVEFSETSLIVTLWTREFGRLSAIAKGARRAKGPFEGSLDLLSVCRVVVIRKSNDALDLLTEAKLNRRFRGGQRSLARVYGGYHVAEMLRMLTDDHDPHRDLYDLTIETLSQLDGDGNVAAALVNFDIAMLRVLGNSPGLDRCTHCGGALPDANRRLAFSLDTSGLVCTACRPVQRQIIAISRRAVDAIRRLQGFHGASMLGNAETMSLLNDVYGEVRGVLNRYFQAMLGKTPRMQAYLPTKMATSSTTRPQTPLGDVVPNASATNNNQDG